MFLVVLLTKFQREWESFKKVLFQINELHHINTGTK